MKSITTSLLLLLVSAIACPANAEMENWYSYWGIGFSDTTYPEPLDSLLDTLEATTNTTRIQLNLDILGFYFPVGSGSTIAGFVINGAADRLDDGSDNIQINLYTYGLSVMTFLGKEPGDGLFLRGDFGITKAVLTSSLSSSSIGSDTGTGYLIGAGYGIVLSEGSRLLLNLNFANRTIESENYSTTGFSVGVLF
jgi:hypothetical protein